jgi:hypothetical protein
MKRSYYSNSIQGFLEDTVESIMGQLSMNHTNRTLEDQQRNAWRTQIDILQLQLKGFQGKIYFEFSIPRMGKRVDNIIILDDIAFIIEFKVGADNYASHAVDQAIDYALDLRNFHEGSHHIKLVPLLVATEAPPKASTKTAVFNFSTAATANQTNLATTLRSFPINSNNRIITDDWERSAYKPTPTIIEAAQALYQGHEVEEISRSDADAINLSQTSECINNIIERSKKLNRKSICFVTGVPGAGKTLAGLSIANGRMNPDEDQHAVFLSGNGPLVDVLREALTRDEVRISKAKGEPITKREAATNTKAFIQNIHHFRDDNLRSEAPPVERVVVFDEAQRAWNKHQTSSFMKRKRDYPDFNMSEPEFLISVMNKHQDWCTIICLIGGGQEINTGEAGLEEWIISLKESEHFTNWDIHYANTISRNDNYIKSGDLRNWLSKNGTNELDLHLSVSLRSFRSEKLSAFIHDLLELEYESARSLFSEIQALYPIVLTRNLERAKNWLKSKRTGSERIGLISSSGARRLRPLNLDVKNEISAANWFLNDSNDIRSSSFLEEVATEFDIQGLEIDWACLAWGANFHLTDNSWKHQNFKGSKWQNINLEIDKSYLKNTYRVLLTRARQGMVIFIPEGSDTDHTRPHEFYDETYHYLKYIGLEELH